MIPYGKQDITQEDIDSVVRVLRSPFLTQGPVVPAFEGKVTEYCGSDFAVAANSATSALHLACLAIGLGPGDILWTAPITFVASANCALYCGASVDFVDINPGTFTLCPRKLEEKLINAKQAGCLPKVVVPVHMCGQSCEMDKIYELGKRYGFRIIEDASHAIGGKYLNGFVGNCQFSDITIFSFHPVKIIASGEGGMATTNDADLAVKMRLLRSHGVTRDPELMNGEPDGGWYYQQVDLGFNYRMTDIHAALGLSQMDRLENYIQRRNELAERYDSLLSDLPVLKPMRIDDVVSSWHLYVVRLKLERIGRSHKEVFDYLRENGVGVNLHYIPVHTQPYYQRMGFSMGDFPCSEQYYREAISLPMYPTLTEEEQDQVVEVLQMAVTQ